MNRRRFLRVLGGGVIVAAGAAFAVSRIPHAPDSAIAPWRLAGAPDPDPRRVALSYAILAPNPHNKQPWIVDLREPGVIVLHHDMTRLLPQTDPFGRQLVVGHGAFLELLSLAAAAQGFRAETELFPDGPFPEAGPDARAIARIRLVPAEPAQDPLFEQVLVRRTNRAPYDMAQPVPPDALAALVQAGSVGGCTLVAEGEGPRMARLRELMLKGYEIEFTLPRTRLESVEVTRIGSAEIAANPDGITLGGPMMEVIGGLGLLTRENMMEPGTFAYDGMSGSMREAVLASPAAAWLVTEGNTRADQIAAGRAFMRFTLALTALGLSYQPNSQTLQEFPEMAEAYGEVHQLLGVQAPERVQMLVRLGYGDPPGPAPRRALDSFIQT